MCVCVRACVRACVRVCAATTVGSGGNPLQEFGHGFTESVYSRVTNRYVSTLEYDSYGDVHGLVSFVRPS